MSPDQSAAVKRRKAQTLYDKALAAYERWDVEDAVRGLEAVVALHPDNAAYQMRLAQVLSRSGDFDRALRALANYLRLEPESKVASRIEQLFASGMDPVENQLTEKMTASHLPIDLTGAAIQMWVEFRISLGEEPLAIPKPEAWAAALDYTVRKVNLHDVSLEELVNTYESSAETIRKHHETLVTKLDIMPCDYRYFTGKQNPLDKLVEAAELLEKLEARFRNE
ncbi:MAG: tetratricopeptide repeat protein [Anaerolineae bacterium]|nr:tetratricopeptide repeat protein [Anaerolineae bacterium]